MPTLPRNLRGEVATIQRDFIYPAYDGTEAWGRDEVLREEGGYGYRRWDIYTRLLIDAHVGAVFQRRWDDTVGREWEIEPGDKSFKARKAAEMCEAQLRAMGSRPPMWEEKNELVIGPASAFEEGILALQSSILYGLAPVENMWAQDGNEVYIESLFPRDIRRFMMVAGPRGYRLRLRVQDAPAYGESLDPRKFTVARYCYLPTEDPWGLGKGAQLFYPTWAKKNCAKFWLIFADKMGNPTSVIKVPQGTKPEKRAEYLTMLQAIASDSGIVIDDNVVLEFADAATGANQTHSGLIDWANDEISKAILSETGTTDQSRDGGSRAQDEVADEQRLGVAKADADRLSNLLNRTLLRHITYFNFGDGVASPRIWWKFPELEERMDRQKEAQVVVSLSGAGFVPTRDWVEEKFEIELDEVADQESPLGGLFAGDEDSPINGGADEQVDLAEGDDTDPVKAMIQTALASTPKPPLLGKVAGLLDEADSLQQVKDELPDVLDRVNQDFADVLAGAIATAELQGRWEVVGEALEDEVIDNAEAATAPAVPNELPDDPSPKQLQALVVAIAREEFEPDAVAAGPIEFTAKGWKMLYSSVKSRNRQFLLEWDGSVLLKGVVPGAANFAETDEAEVLDFAAQLRGQRRKTPKCNSGKSHLCRAPGGSGACISLSKKCEYKPDGSTAQAADYVATKGRGAPKQGDSSDSGSDSKASQGKPAKQKQPGDETGTKSESSKADSQKKEKAPFDEQLSLLKSEGIDEAIKKSGLTDEAVKRLIESPEQMELVKMAVETLRTGEAPSLEEVKGTLTTAGKSFARDPLGAIRRGRDREKLAKYITQEIEQKEQSDLQFAKRTGKIAGKKLKKWVEENPDQFEEIATNTGGFLGSLAGGLAGDLGGSLSTRKAIGDYRALLRAKAKLSGDEAYAKAGKLAKLKQLGIQSISELKNKETKALIRNNVVGDVSGWALGNGAGSLIPVPLSGMAVAMLIAPRITEFDSRTRTGESRSKVAKDLLKELGSLPREQLRKFSKDAQEIASPTGFEGLAAG